MQKPPSLPPEVALCSQEAFIDRKEFILPIPPEDDRGFQLWQAQLATKYPALLKSYDILRGCWDTYHGNAVTK